MGYAELMVILQPINGFIDIQLTAGIAYNLLQSLLLECARARVCVCVCVHGDARNQVSLLLSLSVQHCPSN
jgi:DNA-nicking Smr family endonuclease